MAEGWWEAAAIDCERLGPLVRPVVARCRAARDHGAFPHALLLIGPAGLGRELAAVEIAALLVHTGLSQELAPDPTADRVRGGNHPDVTAVTLLPKKKQIVIDQVREIINAAPGRPFEGAHRVWIFDSVERSRLGLEAANAFLKILEEPPPHVVFLLLAANPEAVLPTIRSRCQRLLLPGEIAAAELLASDHPRPELGAAATDTATALELVRTALTASLAGEPRGLVQLPDLLASVPALLPTVAAAAIDLAAAAGGEQADDLTRLAADLLRLDQRARALNLDQGRQLVARLMAFHHEHP